MAAPILLREGYVIGSPLALIVGCTALELCTSMVVGAGALAGDDPRSSRRKGARLEVTENPVLRGGGDLLARDVLLMSSTAYPPPR
jgi:hypothetical protein